MLFRSESMLVFDAHCDTLTKLEENPNENLLSNSFCFDLTRARQYGGFVQCFAAWVDKENAALSPKNQAQNMINRYFKEIEKKGETNIK